MAQLTNPEREQDRVSDIVEMFDKYGYVMFPEQEKIYQNIGHELYERGFSSVLDAGCGIGIGTYHLAESCDATVSGADKNPRNITFAETIYYYLAFHTWDITEQWHYGEGFDAVVCVETIEHIKDDVQAIRNLWEITNNELWLSTPNGEDRAMPPENPFHVREYTKGALEDLIFNAIGIPHELIEWFDWSQQHLVCRIRKA